MRFQDFYTCMAEEKELATEKKKAHHEIGKRECEKGKFPVLLISCFVKKQDGNSSILHFQITCI